MVIILGIYWLKKRLNSLTATFLAIPSFITHQIGEISYKFYILLPSTMEQHGVYLINRKRAVA
jgi:hypothetical protein